jgi:hypothetical protein
MERLARPIPIAPGRMAMKEEALKERAL